METPSKDLPEGAGNLYSWMRKPFLRPAWDLLEKLGLQKGERLLFVPARNGDLLKILASILEEGRITALEFHPALAGRALGQVEEMEGAASRVEILEAPPHLVPSPGGQDVLLCHFHMPALSHPASFAKAVRRNLRPGGRFAVQVPVEGFCGPLEEALVETLAAGGDLPDPEEILVPLDAGEFLQDFREAGFRVLEKLEKVYLERFPTAMEAADTLFEAGGWGGLEDLTPQAREEAAREIRLRLARRFQKDQDLEIPFRRLLLFGKR